MGQKELEEDEGIILLKKAFTRIFIGCFTILMFVLIIVSVICYTIIRINAPS